MEFSQILLQLPVYILASTIRPDGYNPFPRLELPLSEHILEHLSHIRLPSNGHRNRQLGVVIQKSAEILTAASGGNRHWTTHVHMNQLARLLAPRVAVQKWESGLLALHTRFAHRVHLFPELGRAHMHPFHKVPFG